MITLPNGCHNPYFSRWFSAMRLNMNCPKYVKNGHNPYFSRWFSAIIVNVNGLFELLTSQSLF